MDDQTRQSDPFLIPGIEVGDVPRLEALLNAKHLLRAFMGIFRGTHEEVVVRILVLATLASRGEAPRWTPAEVDSALGYIEPVSLETARTRLSKYGLILYDAADGTYAVSDVAFLVLAAWAQVMQFVDTRFGEFALMNAQILGGSETLGVSEDILRFALARTNTLHHDIEHAIVTGSRSAIQDALTRVKDVFQWGEQGVELLERIVPDETVDSERRAAARRLAHAQGQMLGLAPRLDRTLHALDAQRLRLGESGLDTADVEAWLRMSTVSSLVDIVELAGVPLHFSAFIHPTIAIDTAEELLESDGKEEVPLPPPQEPVELEMREWSTDTVDLDTFCVFLDGVDEPVLLTALVNDLRFDEASYRFSLLPMLGAEGDFANDDVAKRLSAYPLTIELTSESAEVPSGEVASISAGTIQPKEKK